MTPTTYSSFAVVHFLSLVFVVNNAFLVRSDSISKNGDIVITALIDVHLKTQGETCALVMPQGLAAVAAVIYATEQINRDRTLLPNITLGYEITDTCSSPVKANKIAFSFVERNALTEFLHKVNQSCGGRNTTQKDPVSLVIAGIGSPSAVVVANMLQARQIPLISAYATSDELSSPYYETFFRTVIPDSQQAKAVADLIEHFEWTYVGIVAGDGSYGRYGAMALEDEAHKRESFCVAYIEHLSQNRKNKLKRAVADVKRNTKVKVVVLWVNLATAMDFMEEAYNREVFGRTWIAPDGWSEGVQLFTDKYFPVIGGFLGTTLRSFDIPQFKSYVQNLSFANELLQKSTWWSGIWDEKRGNCTEGGQCEGSVPYRQITDELYQKMHDSFLGYLFDAVYAAAHALDALCRHGNKSQCSDNEVFIKGADLLTYLKHASFKGITGEVRLRHNAGQAVHGGYDVLNLQRGPNGTLVLQTVGSWDGAKRKKRLAIRQDLLVWNDGSSSVPVSACSLICPPGTMQTSTVSCCWDCLPCTGRRVSGKAGSENCTKCADNQQPNKEHTMCEELPVRGLKWSDGSVISITACAALGLCLIAFVLITFIRFRNSPIVKSANPELSYCLMFAITLGYFSTIISLLSPSKATCYLMSSLHILYRNICVSVLFLKTNRVLHVFQLSLLSSSFTRWCCNRKNQFILLAILNLVPVSLLIVWLVLDPPEAVMSVVIMQHQYLECYFFPRKPAGNLLVLLSVYILIVSIICTYYAFKTRKLPGNFNEAKFITFAMCIQLMCVVGSVTAYSSLRGTNLVTFDSSIALISAFGFLLCMFGPKMYVIYRHPEKNTTEYVKYKVANYTMRNSHPSVISVGSSDRARAVSALSAVSDRTEQTSLQSLAFDSLKHDEHVRAARKETKQITRDADFPGNRVLK